MGEQRGLPSHGGRRFDAEQAGEDGRRDVEDVDFVTAGVRSDAVLTCQQHPVRDVVRGVPAPQPAPDGDAEVLSGLGSAQCRQEGQSSSRGRAWRR